MASRNLRLYDAMTLQALMLAALATYNANKLGPAMRRVDAEMHKLLSKLDATDLGNMTKAQLREFLREVRETSHKLLANIANADTKRLTQFADVTFETTSAILDAEGQPMPTRVEGEELVRRADREPMADGSERSKLWLLLLAGTARNYENAVKSAYASNGTRADIAEMWANVGRKAWLQSVGISKTSSTHISSQVSSDLLGGAFEFYIWLSVMDSKTSDICRERNKRVFRFGKGPVPPAHFFCRSHISPVAEEGGDIPSESLFDWWQRQPKQIQHIAIPSAARRQVDIKKLTAEELHSISKVMTLPPEELAKRFKQGLEHIYEKAN